MTNTCLLVLIPACLLAGCSSTREEKSPAPLPLGLDFTLGQYKGELAPAPVAIHLDGKWAADECESAPPQVVAELSGKGDETAVYPCALLPSSSRLGKTLAIFTPFPLPRGDEWRAGMVRNFRMRPASAAEAAGGAKLEITSDESALTVANAFYRISLAPVAKPLSGSANKLIQKIAIIGGREFTPTQTISDLSVDKQSIHQWHFSPELPPKLESHGGGVTTVSYGGVFQKSADNCLAGVTWRISLTFFADSPLVKIRFTRRQARPHAFLFGRSLQIYFNPKAANWPVVKEQVTMAESRDWQALSDPQGQIAILLPDAKTRGLAYWSPDWGYLCASWEAGGLQFAKTSDAREFYLLLSAKPEDKARMERRLYGLRMLSEADWQIRIRRLFEDGKP